MKTLKTTPHYKLVIGKSEIDATDVYQIVNRETKVVEVETKLLPQAYKYLEEADAALDGYINPKPEVDISKAGGV
jgi:hypothetical protein